MRAKIASQGKEDFMTECAANDPRFTEEDWVDAFEWLTVSVHCPDCGYTDAHWVEYETM